jgi:hypothetical protein
MDVLERVINTIKYNTISGSPSRYLDTGSEVSKTEKLGKSVCMQMPV